MLAKNFRLTKNKEFDNVFKNGKSSYGQLLGLKIVKNDLNVSRFGILIGLKISKKAVVRNKIKRQIRAILKEKFLDIKPGYDLAVVVFPLILANKYEDIERSVVFCLKRAKLFK